MNIIKKTMVSALLALAVFGLTVSWSATADGCVDVACGPLNSYCTGCHGVIVNGIQVAGVGGKICAQRTVAEWTTTITRMTLKGCPVPVSLIDGMANYLASLGDTTTTTTTSTTVTTTTTTTLCNSYVNGTTQYPYSGTGTCHSYVNDSPTGAHIVRDQKYCQKHMTHVTSSGNHVHAYPHPMCM